MTNWFGSSEDFVDYPCHCVCDSNTHGKQNSSSVWVLATLSILLNIYFLVYYFCNNRKGSKQGKSRELGSSIRNENNSHSYQEPSRNALSMEAIESTNHDQKTQIDVEIGTGNH